MRQYDVYQESNARRRKSMPYLVVLQADVVAETDSVIVAALAALEMPTPSRLYPELEVEGILTPCLPRTSRPFRARRWLTT